MDSGNLLFRTPRIPDNLKDENLLKADLIIKAFNKIGCDAFNVGLYDLAMGKHFLLELQKKANFPFLSANFVDKNTGKPIFEPYIIKQIGGVRVGIFGLISDQRKFDGYPNDVLVKDPVETAREIVGHLKGKCDFIVALVQLTTREDVRLDHEIGGINFIINGYRRAGSRPLGKQPTRAQSSYIDKTVILESFNQGRKLGRLELNIIDNSYQFSDYSQKAEILGEIESLKHKIGDFGEELGASSSVAEKIEATLVSLDKAKNHLEAVQGGSYYINRIIRLDDKAKEDLDIRTLVKHYKDHIKKMRKPNLQNLKAHPTHPDVDN